MSDIKCPECGNVFPMEAAVTEEYKKELREQMLSFKKQKDEEFAKREKEILDQMLRRESDAGKKFEKEKQQLQSTIEESLRRNISADFENKLRLLEDNNRSNEEKLKLARQKEMEFLQKEQALMSREAELEISVQRKLQEERSKLSEELRKIEEQKTAAKESEYQLRVKELEKQLEDQQKLAAEMKRKAELGSSQLHGEIQELALEALLQSAFPFDLIQEVGKGVRGADCVHIVRNSFGQECGKIIYESKRTAIFGTDWVEKLKTDMRSQGADIAVIVSEARPRDMSTFGERNGVWVCNFVEVKALATVLRDSILRIFNASKSQQNRGDKMHLLYDYLTSTEFSEQWKAIREGFMSMKLSIQKERDAMERLWKAREKQLEKVLLNAAHVRGSIEGIAGMDAVDLNLIEGPEENEDDNAH
ncbi:MAG: DUF2130 domain-containing protein [Gemmatimonadaceae bacterium]|nr:DUF2130 domain-containing protein [Chitinophagaceae bacterium]